MRKSRFSDDQIFDMLKELATGEAIGTLCRRHDISRPTLDRRRQKDDGMDGKKVRRPKALEEDARLKRPLAEKALDNHELKRAPPSPRGPDPNRVRAPSRGGAANGRRTLIILGPTIGGRSSVYLKTAIVT